MWLLPVFDKVAALSLKIYFRVSREGHTVPATGPVLLVANHPNSLVDPAFVTFAARRPVRFLAKADLFEHPVVGWLVRGFGSIPVYRKQDDPALMARNAEMFSAVQKALVGGAAVGLFPEGISHSEPSIVALRTGAARIALGAAVLMDRRDFPIVPVGLVFRNKTTFRSRAHAIVGQQIDWRDLAARTESDADAVRILTERIDKAIRAVTINVESWADAPIVELAEAIYAAELELRPDAVERVARVHAITDSLTRMRKEGSADWISLADDLRRHSRLLRWFQLTPRSLRMVPGTGTAIGWAIRRIPLAIFAATGVWFIGAVLFWLPYRATTIVGSRAMKESVAVVATTNVIAGTIIFSLWIAILSGIIAFRFGVRAGIIALLVLPLIAISTLLVRERLFNAVREVRRFFRLSRSAGAIAELRSRQTAIFRKLQLLWARVQAE